MLLHHRQVLAMQQCSPPPMGSWPGPTSCSGRSYTVRAVSKSSPRPVLQASAGAATSSSSRHPQSVTFFSSSQRLDFSSRDAHQGCRSVSNSQTGRNMEEIEVSTLSFLCNMSCNIRVYSRIVSLLSSSCHFVFSIACGSWSLKLPQS